MNSEAYSSADQSVDSICQSLVTQMQSLEDDRLRVRRRTRNFWLITLLIVALTGLFLFWYATVDLFMGILIGVCLIGTCIFYFFYVNVPRNNFKQKFKENVIRKLLQGILQQPDYKPDNYVSLSEYNQSQLFTQGYDRHSGANYVSGVTGKTAITFSELHTEYKTVTHTKNGTRTTWHTIFQGVFMYADSNKNFAGRTYILPDVSERFLGSFGKWLQRNIGDLRGKIVYLENPEFEKQFAVYATDPVEARYLITPQMQERMLALKKYVGVPVFASFVNNKLYLAINNTNGLFVPDMGLSLLKVETIRYYARDIVDIIAIVDILELNVRIWGRQ